MTEWYEQQRGGAPQTPAGPPAAAGAPQMWTPPSYASAAPGAAAPEGYGAPDAPPTYGAPYGYGYPYGYAPARPMLDKGARNALIMALVAFLCFGMVLGPMAIAQGVQARGRIRVSQGRLTGDGLALAGIILGAVATVAAAVSFFYFMNAYQAR